MTQVLQALQVVERVGGLAVLTIFGYWAFKLLGNHLKHMQASYDRNTDIVEGLMKVIENCRYNRK